MNDLTIIGNLTQDPAVRSVNTASGTANVCDFTVAVNRVEKGQKVTDFFRVSCWNRQADNAMKYLNKGSKVCVRGVVTARGYAGKDGQIRASLEVSAEKIEYLSARPSGDGEPSAPPAGDGFVPYDGDELPF